jgi:hypothetical protein
VFAVNVAYPLDEAVRVLAAWRDAVADAPDELSTAGFIWSLPEVEELPEELRGLPYVGIVGMWAGDPNEGERAMQALREIATPIVDMSGRVDYLEFQGALDAFFPAGQRRYWKALYWTGSRTRPSTPPSNGRTAGRRTTRLSSSATAAGRCPVSPPRRPRSVIAARSGC